MYNLRYHIASLVAVFLSLAVGLLLGTVVVERGVLDQQKTTLVEGLTRDFEEMRTTNTDMRGQLDRTSAFAVQTVRPLVASALSGRAVLVVTDPARGDTITKASDTIRLAGGTPLVATFQNRDFGLGDEAVKEKVVGVLGPVPDADLSKKVAEALAREFTLPEGSRPLATALVDAGQLSLEGSTPTMTIAAAIVTGAYGDKADGSQIALLAAVKAQGRPAAGVESAKRATGVAEAAAAAGCSAVDDVDDPLGQVSLVWVLAGRATGYFGIGTGADGPFPDPLFASD